MLLTQPGGILERVWFFYSTLDSKAGDVAVSYIFMDSSHANLFFSAEIYIFNPYWLLSFPHLCKNPFIKHPSNYPVWVCHLFAVGLLTANVERESNECQRLSVLWNSGEREGVYPCGLDRKCWIRPWGWGVKGLKEVDREATSGDRKMLCVWQWSTSNPQPQS